MKSTISEILLLIVFASGLIIYAVIVGRAAWNTFFRLQATFESAPYDCKVVPVCKHKAFLCLIVGMTISFIVTIIVDTSMCIENFYVRPTVFAWILTDIVIIAVAHFGLSMTKDHVEYLETHGKLCNGKAQAPEGGC